MNARLAVLAPLSAVLVALVAAFAADGAGLTDAARAIRDTVGLSGDGAATWHSVAPLGGILPRLDPTVGHLIAMIVWGLVALSVYGVGRRLRLGATAAGLAALAVAAHPVGAAVHGDLAASGVLVGMLGMVASLWALLSETRRFKLGLAACALMVLGMLGHPVALLAPALAALAWWALGRPMWRGALMATAALALGLGVWIVASASGAQSMAMESEAPLTPSLVGRAMRVGVLGFPLTRHPWDLAALDLIVGIVAVLAGALLLWRARAPGARFGVALAVGGALLVALLAWVMPAAQPPALLLPVTIGASLALASLVAERAAPLWIGGATLLVVAALLLLGRPVTVFSSELALVAHELDALGDPEPLRARLAERALEAGAASNALRIIDASDHPRHVPTRVRALLILKRWNDAERAMRGVSGNIRASLDCSLAAARSDVRAPRLCREALKADPADYHASMALARAYTQTGRKAEAEQVLKGLVAAHPTQLSWDALVDHYLLNGWVREAAAALEQRLAEVPTNGRVKAQLVETLLRKVRGDLLEQRFEAARDAARRLLVLAPARHEVRYYLADALEALGDAPGATRERETARAAGAEKPPPVAGIPGAVPADK